MKTKSKIGGHIIRSTAYAVLLSLAFIALSSGFNSLNGWNKSAEATAVYDRTAKIPVQARALTFAERVVFQLAIEDIYWRHRIWPKENADSKPSLDAVTSQAQLQNKVASYLRDSRVLEDYWQKPITADQLQAEMNRMAQHTKQPEVMRELFAALGNDPFVIAECLARPLLADRLLTHSASEQVKQTNGSYEQVTAATGNYTLPSISDTGGCADNTWTATSTTNAPSARRNHTAVWTGSEMITWGGYYADNDGGRYTPSIDSWTATTTVNAPSARSSHTAIWTGSEMIVWGGVPGQRDDGGKYFPTTDSWIATSTANAPTARNEHKAVWTGGKMIVWGGNAVGVTNTGGTYCAPALPAQLGNISTRAFVQTGDNVVIGGFIVQGTQTKRVIIRAIGPELSQYGIPNALANPTLELHDSMGALIASNDNWQFTIIGGIITQDQGLEIRDSGYAPGNPLESAVIAELRPGNYTAIVRGVNSMTGVALVEAYDLSGNANAILANISTRAFVQTADNVMIGGFILQGAQPKRVIIRAIGPELSAPPFNIPNALANPTLELHNAAGALIASNDNWQFTIIGGIITHDQGIDIRNSGHAPGNPLESAVIADLPPGNYTAIVRGVNNTTGVALVEVYDLD
jgi:hypothetical protein